MAGSSIIAKRYARAYLASCADLKETEEGLEVLEGLTAAMKNSPDLNQLLESSGFSSAEKWGVVEELLTRLGAHKGLLSFAKVLTETDRIALLADVTLQLKSEVLARLNEVEAIVESAYPLEGEEWARLIKSLESGLGKKLRPVLKVRPELVAGLRIQVGGRTLDSSLASSLNKMKKQLIQAEA